MASVKKNFFYSTILTGANYIFPFITYPYVSRVLGVANIGVCNFVDSIVHYFILFSMLGMGTVGIREIAKYRNDKAQLSRAFNSLLALNTLTTTIGLVIYVVALFTIPKLQEYRQLMWVGAFKLIFNYLLIEWAYKGLEEFKYITMRTLLVRVLYVVSVFIFIHDADDYPIYYLLGSAIVVVNALINVVHVRKFVTFSLRGINFRPYLSSFFILGLYAVLTSMYTSFNIAYLGFATNETQVGYYTTATKLYSILLAVFTALTGVLMPRMSYLVSQGKMDEFRAKLSKSLDALFAFTLPTILLTTIYAPEIINIVSGAGYEGAILPMRIVMPLMLVIGYEQILVIQTLSPLRADRKIFINSVLGAVVGVAGNILLVGRLQATGSAIVWIISELVVLVAAQVQVSHLVNIGFPYIRLAKSLLWHVPLSLIVLFVHSNGSSVTQLLLMALLTAAYCLLLQVFILKNPVVLSVVKKLMRKPQG